MFYQTKLIILPLDYYDWKTSKTNTGKKNCRQWGSKLHYTHSFIKLLWKQYGKVVVFFVLGIKIKQKDPL